MNTVIKKGDQVKIKNLTAGAHCTHPRASVCTDQLKYSEQVLTVLRVMPNDGMINFEECAYTFVMDQIEGIVKSS